MVHKYTMNRNGNTRNTLAGERVHIQLVEQRLLIYYCNTLVREIDPSIQRSTIVERWIENKSKN